MEVITKSTVTTGRPRPHITAMRKLLSKVLTSRRWNSRTRSALMSLIFSWSLGQVGFSFNPRKTGDSLCAATSAYDDTIQWVRELLAFLKGLINNHPKVKLCGES